MRCAVEYQLKSLALEVNVNRKACPYIKSFFRQPSTHERVLQLHCYIPLMIDQARGLLIALIRQHTEMARGFELLPPNRSISGRLSMQVFTAYQLLIFRIGNSYEMRIWRHALVELVRNWKF